MPDTLLPLGWRRTLRAFQGATYLAVAAMGVVGIIFPPMTIAAAIGEPLTYWWTGLAAAGAIVCFLAVLTDRYRVEWVAVWPTIGGTLIYAITVWGLVTEDQVTRSAQAVALTALVLSLATRGVRLAGHAAQLRAVHRREA